MSQARLAPDFLGNCRSGFLRPACPLVDPGAQQADFLGGQFFPDRRHDNASDQASDDTHQLALSTFVRNNDRARIAPLHRGAAAVEPKAALLHRGTMANLAAGVEKRLDVAGEVDFFQRGCGKRRPLRLTEGGLVQPAKEHQQP